MRNPSRFAVTPHASLSRHVSECGERTRLAIRHINPLARFACLALADFVAALPWVTSPHADEAAQVARGRAIAIENCGRCHAVGPTGESPNPKSPPFRSLTDRYPLSNLEEALGEGIMVGHEGLEMPHFQLTSAQVGALMAYLASVQKK